MSIAPPRQLFQQESFSGEQHRALFREMSLGIQREAAEEGGGFFTLSPTERSLDPMVGGAPAAAEAQALATFGMIFAAIFGLFFPTNKRPQVKVVGAWRQLLTRWRHSGAN